MFTPSLDHLHILLMLIMAFFSFRAYHNNTLAIEYQPEQENVQQNNHEVKDGIVERLEEEVVEGSEMRSEDAPVVSQVENNLLTNVVQPDSITSMNVQTANSANILSDVSLSLHKPTEITTIQGSFDKIDQQSSNLHPSLPLEKDEDQESTLVRGQSKLQQQECDEKNECSSSNDSSDDSSSQGSDDEARVEKRKRIRKEKRLERRVLRRETELDVKQVELIVID